MLASRELLAVRANQNLARIGLKLKRRLNMSEGKLETCVFSIVNARILPNIVETIFTVPLKKSSTVSWENLLFQICVNRLCITSNN